MEDLPTQYHERHGRTYQNTGDRFEGGGQDYKPDEHDEPVALVQRPELDDVGERQAEASSYMAQGLQLPIRRVYHSPQNRAKQTATIFVDHHPDLSEIAELPGIHEIDHGSLQRDRKRVSKGEANVYRAKSDDAMKLALGRCGLGGEVESIAIRYAEWFTLNGRGDGESYLAAGIRAYRAVDAIKDEDGALIVSHNGSGREMRAIATATTLEQRMELSALYDEHLLGVTAVTQQRVEAARVPGRELSIEELTELFMSLAHAAVPVAQKLLEWGVPLRDGFRRVPNATIGSVGIRADGLWVRGELWQPRFPQNKRVPLRRDTVKADILPSGWV
ncbi:MAG TPA: histidine phosphatase family protein [Candidatus Saccharimonadia bacterium]|nr:histidine phosphatase family protein [Candidatus Saccharimonadia bacterium]